MLTFSSLTSVGKEPTLVSELNVSIQNILTPVSIRTCLTISGAKRTDVNPLRSGMKYAIKTVNLLSVLG